MREKDIKILWGRSGNRCAICKLELTPDGSRETLGEMAHIIARSLDGPRGSTELVSEERDSYDNLILLCPTHHSEVDKNFEAWPIGRLWNVKADHEQWVSERLGAGQISVQPLDNSTFLNARRSAWTALARSQVALAISLTPLRVSTEALEPLNAGVIKALESARVPDGDRVGTDVNPFKTRPTAAGVANEDFREGNGSGHRLEVFRVGHCEYFLELGASVRTITEFAKTKSNQIGDVQVIRYTDVAEGVELGLGWLWSMWTILPYTYMSLTVRLINTENTVLYSREESLSGALYGFTSTDNYVEYSDVLQRSADVKEVLLSALRRVANAYGLVLSGVHDQKGQYVRPQRMR